MTARVFRWSAILMIAGLVPLAMSGCVVPGGGYGYGPGFGLGYYEPAGVAYGGWGPGYNVGPVRAGQGTPYQGGQHPPPRGYQPPPASRPIPSIPSHAPPGGVRPQGQGQGRGQGPGQGPGGPPR